MAVKSPKTSTKLNTVRLVNWQKHRTVRVSIPSRALTIIGESETGKTSIIRALRWVLLNQPRGGNQTHHGQKFCSVSIGLGSQTIKRFRSKSKNVYRLNGKKLVSFGAGKVPQAISDVVQMTEVNFQLQTDPLFWLTLPPGQLAKELNAIAELSILDDSLSWLGSETRAQEAKQKFLRDRVDNASAIINRTDWVLDAAPLFRKIEEMFEKLHKEEQYLADLEEKIDELEDLESRPEVSFPSEEDVQRIVQMYERHKASEAEYDRLQELCSELKNQTKELKTWEKYYTQYSQKVRKLPTCPTCGQIRTQK